MWNKKKINESSNLETGSFEFNMLGIYVGLNIQPSKQTVATGVEYV